MQRKQILATIAAVSVLSIGGASSVVAQTGGGLDALPAGFTVFPAAGEVTVRNIRLDTEIPPAVLSTAFQAAEGATFDRAQIDFDTVEPAYELMGKDRDGRVIEVDIVEDGSFREIETQIPRREVPAAVERLLRNSFPNARITNVERSVQPADNDLLQVFYEFDAVQPTAQMREIDISIDSRGTTITVEPLELQVPAFPIPGPIQNAAAAPAPPAPPAG